MSSIQVLLYALCALFYTTWAKDTSDGLAIIGGHNVSITDAPYMAALYSFGKFVCGGSIIHERFILTSAHCIRKTSGLRKVVIGTDSLNAENNRIILGVKQDLCHDYYHPDTGTNDICLLKLFKPIQFGPKIAKINLPAPDFEVTGDLLVNVTGWGKTSSSAAGKKLQQVTIVTVPDWRCHRYFPDLKDTMMCAGSKGHDACQGDNGGPLTLKDIQIDIVSSVKGCGDSTGVYTKVSAYLSWIKNNIEANL